jgi:hypothetical protein
MTVSKELSRNRLDLVGLQDIMWEASDIEQQANTHFSMGSGMTTANSVIFFAHKRIGARGSVVVKALCYKPESRGFETR